ncbi:IX [Canine mastadenovirus A]|uniref:Hexon-interlacing protein IX n=2 Tax=Canine adenovirus serotype 2 TaxID=10514 RepID=CAP9_ADECT|nr:IX [Canine adenovirus 2]P14268.1 RecName: Full=Hexon-interlacing protein; AltName: Full=Protein IX [Canine adenovirus 2 strain Toronto A 26-61]WIV79587.1 IX [Canine mastadenovirus A]AAA42473.1 IX protein [Canine adenovirus 2]AAB38714.1 protein IX [Canine adenovirus 2]QJS39022.1 protein IX [Canine adenovirus 2]UZP80954.1 protein IX [Canine adenovirus 2]
MDPQQKGLVNTCFVTTRIPSWAGARQNVTGSDLEGKPVPSDVLESGRPLAAPRIRTLYEEQQLNMLAVNVLLDELKIQVAAMQNSVTAIQREVNDLKQRIARD